MHNRKCWANATTSFIHQFALSASVVTRITLFRRMISCSITSASSTYTHSTANECHGFANCFVAYSWVEQDTWADGTRAQEYGEINRGTSLCNDNDTTTNEDDDNDNVYHLKLYATDSNLAGALLLLLPSHRASPIQPTSASYSRHHEYRLLVPNRSVNSCASHISKPSESKHNLLRQQGNILDEHDVSRSIHWLNGLTNWLYAWPTMALNLRWKTFEYSVNAARPTNIRY